MHHKINFYTLLSLSIKRYVTFTSNKKLTVSAAVRLIPRPPALVLSRKTKISSDDWNPATVSRRDEMRHEPSKRT